MGGGYGPAYERDVDKVLDDVLDEIITIEAAREQYGVVLDPKTMQVDAQATAAAREKIKTK